MRRFTTALAAAAAVLVTLGSAPAAAAAVAYRVDLWAFFGTRAMYDYGANLTTALTSDIAGAFGTNLSAVSLKDYMLLPDTSENISAVFTVDGGSDTAFLASPRNALAAWSNATNDLLYFIYMTSANREAAAAVASEYYNAAWITNVQRLGSPSVVLPNTRFLELGLHGKHLVTATASMGWTMSLLLDFAGAFHMTTAVAASRITFSSSNISDANNSTLTIRFSVMPLLNVPVNTTTFFASNGTAAWLSNCMNVHTYAAYQDLGIESRNAAAMGGEDLSAETALTVTSATVAPGDEAYTNAPTSAPFGAAAGVTTTAVFAVALVGASLALF